jgi:hypothetical protein
MLNIKSIEFERSDNSSIKAEYHIEGQKYITEEAVLKYYKKNGFDGLWTENGYWLILLSLFFWDEIFAKVDGAVTVSTNGLTKSLYTDNDFFDSHFEFFIKTNGMPSDLFDSSFFEHRRELIINRYKYLVNTNLQQELEKQYKLHVNKYCRLVNNWERYTISELLAPLKYLSNQTVLRILFKILIYPSKFRSGLPDLLVYNNEQIRFIEVKSEKDKLSCRQIGWLAFLALDLQVDVELFLINHTKRKIEVIKKRLGILTNNILIRFDNVTSKHYESMVTLFSKKDDYSNNEGLISASFLIYDTDLEWVVKTVGRSKSTKFFVNGEEYSIEQIRHIVYELSRNNDFDINEFFEYPFAGPDWYNCSNRNLERIDWSKFGYIDYSTEQWLFDKDKLKSEVNRILTEASLCPYLDKDSVKIFISNLPGNLDLKKDSLWAFITAQNNRVIYHQGKWFTNFSSPYEKLSEKPNIIGVVRINEEQRNWILGNNLDNNLYNNLNYETSSEVLVSEPKDPISRILRSVSPRKGDGCSGSLVKLLLLFLVLGILLSFLPTLIGIGIAKIVDSKINFSSETKRRVMKYTIILISVTINIIILYDTNSY